MKFNISMNEVHDEKESYRLENRMCPNLSDIQPSLQIKNGYENLTERVSFGI